MKKIAVTNPREEKDSQVEPRIRPTQKPPRYDLRKLRIIEDQDTRTDLDPDLEPEKND